MRRGRKTESAASRRARKEFTETVLDMGGCQIPLDHTCDGPMDACHVIFKQFLKVHAKTNLRLGEASVLDCVWDPRNGIPGCREGHRMFDSPFHTTPFRLLPSEAVEFAIDYNCIWKLESMYPDDSKEEL
jgi:hypothetical protein